MRRSKVRSLVAAGLTTAGLTTAIAIVFFSSASPAQEPPQAMAQVLLPQQPSPIMMQPQPSPVMATPQPQMMMQPVPAPCVAPVPFVARRCDCCYPTATPPRWPAH